MGVGFLGDEDVLFVDLGGVDGVIGVVVVVLDVDDGVYLLEGLLDLLELVVVEGVGLDIQGIEDVRVCHPSYFKFIRMGEVAAIY